MTSEPFVPGSADDPVRRSTAAALAAAPDVLLPESSDWWTSRKNWAAILAALLALAGANTGFVVPEQVYEAIGGYVAGQVAADMGGKRNGEWWKSPKLALSVAQVVALLVAANTGFVIPEMVIHFLSGATVARGLVDMRARATANAL